MANSVKFASSLGTAGFQFRFIIGSAHCQKALIIHVRILLDDRN